MKQIKQNYSDVPVLDVDP